MRFISLILFPVLAMSLSLPADASGLPEFSTAGFYSLEGSGREVFSMNPAWRFHKGPQVGAEAKDFDDRDWPVVSLPHGIEYLPAEASGCVNYQGEVWYRKHFTPDAALEGKKLFLHFEAIMGKSRIYVNGKLLSEHYGGYLPVTVDITESVDWDCDNVISVCADNSDDPSYPPGKPQEVLDFTYFGGIYRDCWLVAHNRVHITDPNYEDETAGGGLFVSFGAITRHKAEVRMSSHVRNETERMFSGAVEYSLVSPDGRHLPEVSEDFSVRPGAAVDVTEMTIVEDPLLWSPSSPALYRLEVRVKDSEGNVVDGYVQRVGIRSVEFRGKDGFWLNGEPYGKPLIGANRHQDFAIIGNAVPNSLHWRDAMKLKKAGMEVIRNAHCPQDPAFMDACDELGLFVIVNTPGWQFWNDDPVFGSRVYDDIRNMVRRDRNHASVWLWEPILNETWYPDDFALNACRIVDEEYPYPYSYSGCDSGAHGHEHFPVNFSHPADMQDASETFDPDKTYFTREWGDNVDDWSSHSSPSRAARNWGEVPMRVQAAHYACPEYPVTNYNELWLQSPHHAGGCLWHSFDHQRGYHPDPFYGGLMDVFRQPKYSYYMFMSQRPAEKSPGNAGSGPMVYIAHEMTPFSGKDVTVYSNCDEVRLRFTKDGEIVTYTKDKSRKGMPSPVIVFKDIYDFMTDKSLSRAGRQEDVYLLAEGLIDGQVVATHKVSPARRPEKIELWIDDEGTGLEADGSDIVTVVAAITDRNGNIRHLNNSVVRFSIEGEGRLVGGSDIMANPSPVRWGTAPVLVQSTLTPGTIRITASVLLEGSQTPVSGVLELESRPASNHLIYSVQEADRISSGISVETASAATKTDAELEAERLHKEQNALKLREVERMQSEFGE